MTTRKYLPPYTGLCYSVTWNEGRTAELLRLHHKTENCEDHSAE